MLSDIHGMLPALPKWDGFRCLARKAGDELELRAKSGKSQALWQCTREQISEEAQCARLVAELLQAQAVA